MGLDIIKTAFAGLYTVETSTLSDNRGGFTRLFCTQALSSILQQRSIVQINRSHTVEPGSIRGLHFQHAPHAEMKCVRCIRGRIWDVALDIRANSPTFLQWHAVELSEENDVMFVIPEGFAHGFQTLEPDSEILYFTTHAYTPASEGAIRFDDPRAAITWPLPVTQISDKDRAHPLLPNDFAGIRLTS